MTRVVTGVYSAPFPPDGVEPPPWHRPDPGPAIPQEFLDELKRGVVYQRVLNDEVPDDGYKHRFMALRAAVKMAVKSFDVIGNDAYEGVMEGLKDALEEAGS